MSNWNCTVVRSDFPVNSSCLVYEQSGNLVLAESVQCVSDSCSLTVFTNGTVEENPVKIGSGSWCVNSNSDNPTPIIGGVCLPAIPSVCYDVYSSFYTPTTASIAIYAETDSACSGSAVSLGAAVFKTCLLLPYSSDFFMLYFDVLDNIYLQRYSDLNCFNLISATKASPANPCINSMKLTVANSTNRGFEVNSVVSLQNLTQSISYYPTYMTCVPNDEKCYTNGVDFNLTTYSLEVFGSSQPFFIYTSYIRSPNRDCSTGADYETAFPLYQCLNGDFNWLRSNNTVLVTSSYSESNCQGLPNTALQIPVTSCFLDEYRMVYNLDALSSVLANANGLVLVPASGFSNYSSGSSGSSGGSGSGKSTVYIVVGILGGLVLVTGIVYVRYRKYYSDKKKLASEGLDGNELDVFSSSI
ncbi:hypothetical protein HK100_002459 [Physocladia obscura]|uniref:Uncharacterized protein n=1 Tax=Physocladia obscura TaxID=109957 RepID=A0AAD5T1C3_9FUNG|nr:hypothetical protein HK100_002459 [Physocladia obscura]